MQYLTENELSDILRISRSTLWELRKSGMPYRQVRGQIRYRLEEVNAWLDENCAVNRVKAAATNEDSCHE
jgi:predicted DNA-binding transcriptional regulator AlpA